MRKTANRNRRNSLDSFGDEGGWLINKNACEVSTVHKDYGGKLISHTRPTMGRETRLNYWGSSPTGDDRMVNMSRSSPPANCFPPIQSSSLFRPRAFRNIVRNISRLTWKRKNPNLIKRESVDRRDSTMYFHEKMEGHWLFKFDKIYMFFGRFQKCMYLIWKADIWTLQKFWF